MNVGSFRRGRHLAALCAVALFATACGSSGTDEQGSEAGDNTPATSAAADAGNQELHDLLPADIQESGKIVSATEAFYPPFQFAGEDNKTLVGINIDLAAALGEVLGVEIEMVEAKFDAIIPGIQAGRYDISLDAIGDKPERRSEVTFIDYVKSGSRVFVPAQSDLGITGLDESLCGHKIGVVRGTFEVEEAQDQAKKCADGGSSELDVQVFPDQQGMILAVTSGRVDSILLASAVGSYLAKNSGDKFKPIGDLVSEGHQGIVVPKGADDLLKALQGAMQELVDNGEYLKILTKYEMADNAVEKVTINEGDGV